MHGTKNWVTSISPQNGKRNNIMSKNLTDYVDNTTEIITVDFKKKEILNRKTTVSNYIDLLDARHICPKCDLPMILGHDKTKHGVWRIALCLPCSTILPLYKEKKNERA